MPEPLPLGSGSSLGHPRLHSAIIKDASPARYSRNERNYLILRRSSCHEQFAHVQHLASVEHMSSHYSKPMAGFDGATYSAQCCPLESFHLIIIRVRG